MRSVSNEKYDVNVDGNFKNIDSDYNNDEIHDKSLKYVNYDDKLSKYRKNKTCKESKVNRKTRKVLPSKISSILNYIQTEDALYNLYVYSALNNKSISEILKSDKLLIDYCQKLQMNCIGL